MSSLQDVWYGLSTERVNIELMFDESEETGVLVTCRFRPWKVSTTQQRMLLAGGRTPSEAIVYCYMELLEGRWIPLDWRARASTNGPYVPSTRTTRERLDARSLALAVQEARETPDEYQYPSPTPIGLYSGSQNGSEDSRP
jgi:hypothetical protein